MKLPRYALPALSLLTAAILARAEVVERVIVRVNGDIVSQSEFVARQAAAVQAARIAPEGVEAFLRENNAKILQQAIDELLLVQRAAELGYRVPPQYVNELVDSIKKENNIASEEELIQQLRREGMTLSELKRNIERNVLRQQVLQRELQSKQALTEADARADYEAKKAEHSRPAYVHLQEIVIAPETPTAQAQELVKRARAGEDFAELAKAHSAAASRASGGDLGRLNRGDLPPELEKTAFALAAAGVSDPIPTSRGLLILRCVERSEASFTPFEEVKEAILKRMAQERMASQYEAYMEGLRKSALIDLRVREVPLNVTVAPSSLLEPPAATPPAPVAKPTAPDSEFRVTPQAAPQRVAPPAAPGPVRPTPAPTPPPR
jgi:parvulin-like peptidyl-prolyl isomerase